MMKEFDKKNVTMNLAMTQLTVGDHELTYNNIFDLVDGIFRNRYTIKQQNKNAARLLYLSKGIKIPDGMFINVKFGNITALIYDGNLGSNYRGYTNDFAIVNNKPVLFIFSNELTYENVPRSVRTERIYSLFSNLVQLFMVQEYYNFIGSIYSTIIDYAPMVMTVRLIETFYHPRKFSMEKDYDESYFPEFINSWFGQDALDIIHSHTDKELLEFGALIEHVEMNRI